MERSTFIRFRTIMLGLATAGIALAGSGALQPSAAAPQPLAIGSTAEQVYERQQTAARLQSAGADVHEAPIRSHWDDLADCESGRWDASRTPILGSARWDYGLTFSHGDIFEGGLNFHPRTWDAFRDPDMPAHAGQATRSQQIEIGERVLAAQGWGAWPVCSRKVGLR